MTDFTSYQSPFSFRYASPEMRQLWSETQKRLLWRQIWVALAETQKQFGLVTPEQVNDLHAHMRQIDIPRALEIEAEIHHDLMAEVKTYAAQCTIGGGVIHLGATSMDIEDNADALRLRAALELIVERLGELLTTLSRLIRDQADTPLMAFTHIQPAEPSTLGYRLAMYAQDLLEDYQTLRAQHKNIRGKGFKGAVGTSASYAELLGEENLDAFEQTLSKKLALPFYPVATQTYPRKQDYTVLSALAGLGQSLYKLAFDLRILQSPPIGELAEPFGSKQVGSSAMPFKRNPIRAEKIDSLARSLAQMPRVAWDNAAHSLLERTLDDSANRRTLLPEAFLTADEILNTAHGILNNLVINRQAIQRNLATYGPFAATERVMMAATRAGADRQEMHELLREQAMQAWQAVQNGLPNPLVDNLCKDAALLSYLNAENIRELMEYEHHTGNAPRRAMALAAEILKTISAEG